MIDPGECLFCRIVKGGIPAKKVYEDANSLAFLDINPRNPGHTIVIPKKHYETVFDLPDSEGGKYFASIKKVAILVKNGTRAHGISVCQNNGSAAGQVIAHLHFHIIPRFLNEGPAALEAILPVKKMDDHSLEKVAAAIKGASEEAETPSEEDQAPPQPRLQRQQRPQRDPEPESEPAPRTEQKPAKPKKKSPPKDEEDENFDEFEEFGFDL